MFTVVMSTEVNGKLNWNGYLKLMETPSSFGVLVFKGMSRMMHTSFDGQSHVAPVGQVVDVGVRIFVVSMFDAAKELVTAVRTVALLCVAFPHAEHERTTAVLAPSRAARVMVS